MNYILFDEPTAKLRLMPLSLTRPISLIRIGIFTIAEKWQKLTSGTVSYLTDEYLSKKFKVKYSESNIYVNASILPDSIFLEELEILSNESLLILDNKILAIKSSEKLNLEYISSFPDDFDTHHYKKEIKFVERPWDIFLENNNEIKKDFKIIKNIKPSEKCADEHTILYNKEDIYFEEGVKIRAAVLNAESGPIYIGKNVEIQEGSVIRGPFAICESSVINMGSKMRGGTTIGPHSKVGGEISNSIIFGYSNKAHDGFLGNSILGEWCNLGADTNTSNLKNNYSEVKVWSYEENDYVNTGQQFCGLIMGDHSKAGINSMFNTGTVVGVNANIFGGGFPPKFIPSFSWGGSEGFEKFEFEKALQVASKVMERRGESLVNEDFELMKYIYINY